MPTASNARIRSAHAHEAQALSALALRSKAHWGYDALFMLRCRDELTLQPDDVASHPTFVVEADGVLLGFSMLERISDERMELSFLFVEPSAIGRGLGRMLIEHAIHCVRAQGARYLEIVGDPHAVAFYRSAGARQIGERASTSIPGRVLPLLEVDLEDATPPA